MTKVLEIAKAEVGYLEKRSNSKLYSKTDNAGSANYNKYARDMDNTPNFFNGPKNGFDWCAIFMCWCFVQAFGAERAMKLLFLPERSAGASCTYLASRFRAQGRLFAADPKPGDLILYTRDGGSKFYHVGIVTKVTDTKIYTIEGNTSGGSTVIANGGGVFEKEYNKKSVSAWYARPNYDAVVIPEEKETPSKSIEDVARAVINGEYGDGDARKLKLYAEGYDVKAVQNEVNRILNGKTASPVTKVENAPEYVIGKVYVVNVDELSVRVGAGTTNRRKTYEELTLNAQAHAYSSGHIKRGTSVTCLETKIVGGDVWMKIPSGWVAAYYEGKYYIK